MSLVAEVSSDHKARKQKSPGNCHCHGLSGAKPRSQEGFFGQKDKGLVNLLIVTVVTHERILKEGDIYE